MSGGQKGLVTVPQDVLSQWVAGQTENIRLFVFDINIESLEFILVAKEYGNSSSSEDDFALAKNHLKEEKPVLIALRGNSSKWILLAWIPEDAIVKKKMIFASARAALKTQLGADKFGVDYQVASEAECNAESYFAKYSEEENAKTMTQVEILGKEDAKDAFIQASASAVEGLKMLNIKTDEKAVKGFAELKHSNQSAVFFFINDSGDTLSADEALKIASLETLKQKFKPDIPCYVILHYSHVSVESNERETKVLIVYYCSDDAPPRKKMISASVLKNIGAACEALGIRVSKRIEISTVDEFSDAEFMSALYPVAAVREQFAKPAPPRRNKPTKK